MYRPHAARRHARLYRYVSPACGAGDTGALPKLRGLVTANEYDAMAEDFEKKEHALFRKDSFDKIVHRVEAIERTLGIWDLNQFTAR